MSEITVGKISGYERALTVEPDKSISVRAVILCAFARGRSVVKNISVCEDVISTAQCMRQLGADIAIDGNTAYIEGAPLHSAKLDCGNSATAARLITGLVSGLSGVFEITGDASLRNRPMTRVTAPLRAMGARLTDNNGKLPVTVIGSPLCGLEYFSPIPSAQIKSALLLAALSGTETVKITEGIKTRDHTERMLAAMNAVIGVNGNTVECAPSVLSALDMTVPGDISAAVYPICLALATGGKCVVKNVGVNETRLGAVKVLRRAGADITFSSVTDGIEPFGDMTAFGNIKPFVISSDEAPRMIDEIPALAALACFADGTSEIYGVDELRYKESDRLAATVRILSALGADITEKDNGLIIRGGKPLHDGIVDACGDHRIAMTAAVAGAAGGGVTIKGGDCVSVSYPMFYKEVLGV